jgi:hypothetical protein
VECFNLGPTLGCERGMLLNGVRVVAIDPKDRIFNTVADAVATHVIGHLPYAAHTKCFQSRVVEDGGAFYVSDANAGVVNHWGLPWVTREGELSAAVEVRRLFPGITDNAEALGYARTIAGWKPLPAAACQITPLRLRGSRARPTKP